MASIHAATPVILPVIDPRDRKETAVVCAEKKISREANENTNHADGGDNDNDSDNGNGNGNGNNDARNNNSNNKYEGFPLLRSMMAHERTRTMALTSEGSKQIAYPKSNTGWIKTIFTLEARALDKIVLPWSIAALNAFVWAIAYQTTTTTGNGNGNDTTASRKVYIESALEIILATTMAFLLVFRLNRSATRFWMARGCWGIVVVRCRSMVGTILLHGSHDAFHRDEAVRWIMAFVIASMNHVRGRSGSIDPDTLRGILDDDDDDDNNNEFKTLNGAPHPPLHAADKIRYHLSELFAPCAFDADGSFSVSEFRTHQLICLEKQLNVLIDEEGAMERINSTPLPMVYVTHLRTWLLLFLLAMPYFWAESMGYAVVPVVCLVAFALLGLEGAAAEVEAPFLEDRTNHLDMDTFCAVVLSNVLQQLGEDADRKAPRLLLGKRAAGRRPPPSRRPTG